MPTQEMKISIVVPVYNEIITIEEIIKRIKLAQTGLKKEIIIVDDFSTDGTREIISKMQDEEIKKIFLEKNQGKGAAIRQALKVVTGDIVIIQDADLEYHPDEYHLLLEPILNKKADVVFGSRFIGAHRCFLFSHYLGNKFINLIANMIFNTTLSDLMTGYKVFRADIVKDLPLESNRFGFEAEITAIVLRKNLRIYEVPISYSGRDYRAGKKIKWTDFFVVLYWLIYCRFKLLGNVVYDTLDKLSFTGNYNSYIYHKFKNYLGKRILEVGAGNGNITKFLINNKELVVVIDKSREHLFYLSQWAPESSILKIFCQDSEEEFPEALKKLRFDAVVCINVLEHINDEIKVLNNMAGVLGKGGRLILFVPGHQCLFSDFDKSVGHFRRYDKNYIVKLLEDNGFSIEKLEYVNSLGIIGWWFNFRFLRRKSFSPLQLFFFNHFVWLVKILDKIFKNKGLSLLVIAKHKHHG